MTDKTLQILRPMAYYWLYFLISLAFILPGTYSLVRHGLKLSIDFTGGTNIVWQLSTDEATLTQVAQSQGITVNSIKSQDGVWSISTNPLTPADYLDYKNSFDQVQELAYDTVGPSLGAELVQKTFMGVLLSAVLILLYVAYRFQNIKFGVCAIIAMFHDSLILLGAFSLLGYYQGVEVDTLFVTALLTILSFSVHDTIVVYDRIRELKKKHGYLDFADIINRAVVETMGRSINNSLTIIFMLLSMYWLGGETTKWFIFALLIGTISGTYSSPFTAAPLLILWDKLAKKRLG